MYDERLVLGEYGDLVTTYEGYMDKDRLLYLNYKDIEKKIKIESEFINKHRGYSLYCKDKNKECNKKIKSNTKIGSARLNSFLHFLLTDNEVMYNSGKLYNANRNEKVFTVTHTSGNYDFEFTFSNDRAVCKSDTEMEVYKCKEVASGYFKNGAYCEDKIMIIDIESTKNPIEFYQFLDNGYVFFNYEDVGTDTSADVSIFNKGKLFECHYGNKLGELFTRNLLALSVVPMNIVVLNDDDTRERFDIVSNINGVITSFVKTGDNRNNFCRFEQLTPNPIQKNIDSDLQAEYTELSVSPCLYNSFDFNYTDTPMLYWMENKLSYRTDLISVRRNIYRIDQSKLDILLQKVRSESVFPIIDMYED